MPPRVLTIVVAAERPIPDGVMQAMRVEVSRLFHGAGLWFEWRFRSEMKNGVEAENLTVATFRGSCWMDNSAEVTPRSTPGAELAYAHVTDGAILPFAVIHCERVRAAARSAMWGGDFKRSPQLMGRALARVLAHEIFHIIGNEHEQSAEGVFKQALTGSDLIAETLDFHEDDLMRLRRGGPASIAPVVEQGGAGRTATLD